MELLRLEETFKELQHKIRVICNKKEAEIGSSLNVKIQYSCGYTNKTPFLKLLERPQLYEELLHGDTTFQKRLICRNHCKRKLRMLKLKPLKNDKDLQQIWNLEHGRIGTAELTIRLV